MKTVDLGLVVLALFLAGCSKSPSNHLFIKLEVDGKTVIDEKAKDAKTEALSAKYVTLLDTLETACEFSKFLNETVSRTGPGQSPGKSASMQSTEADGTVNIQSLSVLNMQEVQIPDRLVRCTSGRVTSLPDKSLAGFPGCVANPRTGGGASQVQYALKARDDLQAQYGMKKVAILTTLAEESDGGKHQTKIETIVQVSAGQIACTLNLQQK